MSRPGVESRRIALAGQTVDYTLRRSARKTLGLSIDHRGVSVAVPLRVSLGEVEGFLRAHADWILDRLRQRPAAPVPLAIEDGCVLPCLGADWRIRISRGNNRVTWHELGDGNVLELGLRAGSDARKLLLRGVQERALDLFENRVAEFCLRIGQPRPSVGLSSARTRWGSCSSRSGIRLHWRLIHLPLTLIDYVVAHEVAHLLEMNHSPRFWSVVESIYPDHSAARRQLKAAAVHLPHI